MIVDASPGFREVGNDLVLVGRETTKVFLFPRHPGPIQILPTHPLLHVLVPQLARLRAPREEVLRESLSRGAENAVVCSIRMAFGSIFLNPGAGQLGRLFGFI